MVFVEVIAWLEVLFGIIINSTSDISKLLYVISRDENITRGIYAKYHVLWANQIAELFHVVV